jgi:zinc/manganese transport system permease protein
MTGFSWNLIGDLRFMWQYEFIRNAFEAGTMIAILAGVVSYLVVLRRSSFASHAMGEVGFSGAAGAVLVGVNPVFGLLAFTTVAGTGMALLGKKAATRDVEIGTILAFTLALGLLFLSFYRGYATAAYSILFGEIVGISNAQVLITFEVGIPVLLALGLLYKQLLFASLDQDVAEAKGMHVVLLGVVFMLALAVTVSVAVTVVGVLLIFALSVTPAAIAIRLSKKPLYAVVIAVLVALGAMWSGIFIGFYEVEPTSFFIVAIVFVAYVLVRAIPLVPPLLKRLAPGPASQRSTDAAPPLPGELVPETASEVKTA